MGFDDEDGYERNGWDPDELMEGYECKHCGETPTRKQLDDGRCDCQFD